MLLWTDQLFKISLIVLGVCLILFGFVATMKLSIPKEPITQSERIRRSLIVGVAITLFFPGMLSIASGFIPERLTFKVIEGIILSSICFSPMGLAAAFGTYNRLWSWTKLKDDILFLNERKDRRNY